jgi:hypothetical protein
MKVALMEKVKVNILQKEKFAVQNALIVCVQVTHSRNSIFTYQNKKGVRVHAINIVQRAYHQ